jgi:serine O-acetyltransferase
VTEESRRPDVAEAGLRSDALPRAPQPGPWRTTLACLSADRRRIVQLLSGQGNVVGGAWLHPSFVCVVLYRLAHYFHVKGHSLAARLLGQMNSFVTGADIPPATDAGEGLVIVSPAGTALYGKAGRNLTVMPCAGIGGELAGRREDIGGGPGFPVLGDDVVLEPHVGILGPCRVGDRARITAGTAIFSDVPPDTVAEGPRPRFRHRTDAT